MNGHENELINKKRELGPPLENPVNVTEHSETNIYTGVPTIEYEEDKHEKPWQRVLSEVTRKGTHLYEPVKSVPCTLLVLFFGVYLLLGYLTQLVEDEMPRVINEIDISRDDYQTFSEESAWRYLNIILGEGPRVAGTKYHLKKTHDLKTLVDTVASQGSLPVRTDWQRVDGDYWIDFWPPYVNAYQNVSNIVALLEGEAGFHSNGTLGTSLLINCHYDSVPYAMGTSDNAIFCAAMMEVLSKMSRRRQKFKHNVVFLFNGAEENPLQGSHAFLHHPWSKGITNVINLDAGGMNGKPIVFQVTDPRLLRVYRQVVRRPCGQSIGEFLFSTGVIPSDTDFRIWRDFGGFHGVDIAFIKWGHVYHTRYDHPSLVQPGVIQNAGDMLMAVIEELADMEELSTQMEPVAAVYFDYLYWFMISYSFAAAVAVDLLVVLYGLLSVGYYVWTVGYRWTSVQELLLSVLSRLLCLGSGLVVCAIFTPIMVASNMQLRYMSQPWIVVAHYWLPYVLAACSVSQLFDAWRTRKTGLNRSIRSLQAQAATRLLLSAILLAITCVPSLTTLRYIVTVPLVIMSTLSLVTLTVVRYVRLQAWQQLLMEVIFSLPSAMFLISLSLRFNAIMLPTMGRSHSDSPDGTIATINVGLAVITTSTVSGLELLFSRKRLWLVLSPAALVCLVLMFIPFSPYQDDGPSVQRHYWFHTEIKSYNYNNEVTDKVAGVLVTKWDTYSIDTVLPAFKEKGITLNTRSEWKADCKNFVFCNLPLFRVRFGLYLDDSLFLSTGPPAPFNPEPSIRVMNRTCVGETCTFNFQMIGPAHNLITLWPRANINVTRWSFSAPLQDSFRQLNRSVYVIIHSTATYSEPFRPFPFSVQFVVPLALQSTPIVDVSHHAHKIQHPEDYTQEYRSLVDAAPKYFNIASYMSFRINYVF